MQLCPHLKILQRYFTINLIRTTALALIVLVGISSFLSLIDQLEDAKGEDYGMLQVLVYILLIIPRLVYELIPIAAMIGSMATLGLLARNSELNIIRTSGVSKYSLAVLMGKSALVIVLFSILIGEFVAPISEKKVQEQQAAVLVEQISLQTKYGFWARDGNSFVNIRKILSGNKVEDVYIYEFDSQERLRNSIFAKHAEYLDNQWFLEGIEKTTIDEAGVKREEYKKASWGSLLDPEIINLAVTKPQYLTAWGLYDYIQFLKSNTQNTERYRQAFYEKLIRPFTIIAMIILSIPLVRAYAKSIAVGQHVFTGALIGIIFYFCNSATSHIGIVYGIHPFISVAAPTLILFMILCRLLTGRS